MDDFPTRIALIEDEIALVQEQADSCAKFVAGAKIAVAAGGAWIGAILFGFVRLDAVSLTVIVSAIIGGFVFWGSNKASQEQAEGQLAVLRKRRDDLIAALDMRDVTSH